MTNPTVPSKRELLALFGDESLAAGPYRLIEIDGNDGVWRCRRCRAYFLAAVPRRPPDKCAKCGESD